MPLIETPDVGKIWVPELERVTFGPAFPVGRSAHYMACVTYSVRDAKGRKVQAGFGAGIKTAEGLHDRWQESDELQRLYKTPEAYIAAVRIRALRGLPGPSGFTHNERTNNGGNMVSKGFWGSSATTDNATVAAPTRIAVAPGTGSFLAAAAGNKSLGSTTANVTTNEWTSNGLARTGALTPGGVTAPSGLDTQFTLTLSNVFTVATGSSVVNGTALMDNTTTAFNMYAEATFASATLNIGDTLTVTWTVKD